MPAKAVIIAVRDWPSFGTRRPERGGCRMPPPLHGLSRPARMLKRAEDVAGVLMALALFSLPMLLIALAIRLDSPGPVLFRQLRTGRDNHDFILLKFRTMHAHCCEPVIASQARRDDPRLTRLGGLLRRTSLDELPQLFNVLRGDMSLVGPRPHAPGTRAGGRLFGEIMPDYPARHLVKPGITGLAQVRGLRGETRTEEALIRRVESDFEYINRWSLGLDFLVLLRTALCVLSMRNAH